MSTSPFESITCPADAYLAPTGEPFRAVDASPGGGLGRVGSHEGKPRPVKTPSSNRRHRPEGCTGIPESADRQAWPTGGFSMAEPTSIRGRPAAPRSRNNDRSRMVAITPEPEQSCGRPSEKGAGEDGCTRLANILVSMLRAAIDYEANQGAASPKGVTHDPET
jgi:hypothetical protein